MLTDEEFAIAMIDQACGHLGDKERERAIDASCGLRMDRYERQEALAAAEQRVAELQAESDEWDKASLVQIVHIRL
jgi:hypothetical protein